MTFYVCANPVNNSGTNSGDGFIQCTSQPITVNPPPPNDPPTPIDIPNQQTPEDSQFTLTFGPFNDPGDTLTYTAAQVAGTALPGWLSFSGSTRTFSGIPGNSDVGSINVRVTATDSAQQSATDDFVLGVSNVNDQPNAVNDAFTVQRDSSNNTLNVRGNDTDIDMGDTLTITAVDPASHGAVSINAGGASLNYTPAAGFTGTDTFNYTVQDSGSLSDSATVTMTVQAPPPPNAAPVAQADSYSTNEDTTLTVSAPGVLANDTDTDGNALTAQKVANPAHGTVTLNANGSFSYVPAANYNGPDSFTYRANDGIANSATTTVSLTVAAVADAPVATNDSYSTNENTMLSVAAPGVLGNDTDADGSTLIAVKVADPANGTLTQNSNGGFTYTPAAGFNGSDSFTYRANDGGLNSNVATVSITVGVQNDPPVATPDAYTTGFETPLTVAAPGVLANDTDPDGDPLNAMLVSTPASGMVGLNASGGFTYTPSAGFSGTDSFTYQASDGIADSNTATVTVTVSAAPPPGGGGGGGGTWSLLGLGIFGLMALIRRRIP